MTRPRCKIAAYCPRGTTARADRTTAEKNRQELQDRTSTIAVVKGLSARPEANVRFSEREVSRPAKAIDPPKMPIPAIILSRERNDISVAGYIHIVGYTYLKNWKFVLIRVSATIG